MRRRPYSELPGVEPCLLDRTNVDAPKSGSLIPQKNVLPEAPPQPAVLSPETAGRYQAEIRRVFAIVEHHRLGTDTGGQTVCSFIEEKLADASEALDKGDTDGAWFSLFGAAKLCQGFEIQPERAERTVQRIKGLLGSAVD